jgi:hypothetical protein
MQNIKNISTEKYIQMLGASKHQADDKILAASENQADGIILAASENRWWWWLNFLFLSSEL